MNIESCDLFVWRRDSKYKFEPNENKKKYIFLSFAGVLFIYSFDSVYILLLN